MKFQDERFKNHLQRRQSKRKLTTQEQFDLKYFVELSDRQEKLEAMESNPPEQTVFEFDDEAFLKEIS